MPNLPILNELKTDSSIQFGSGYAPAHITAIFEIHNSDPNPLKCGSRGIGFCIDSGVSSFVSVKPNRNQAIDVQLNGEQITGDTTKSAIKTLVGDLNVKILVNSVCKLPLSQGFGLSGAGALSSVVALDSALGLDMKYPDLVNAAHVAEIKHQTGLGDVIAQANGGVVFRKREGGYDFGEVKIIDFEMNSDKNEHIDIGSQFVICILGKKLITSKIITDTKHIKLINSVGKKSLDQFQNSLRGNRISITDFTRISYNFASKIGLMENKVQKLIDLIHDAKAGNASMVMLGNAIFIFGDIKKILKLCSNFGQTMVCGFDKANARVIR